MVKDAARPNFGFADHPAQSGVGVNPGQFRTSDRQMDLTWSGPCQNDIPRFERHICHGKPAVLWIGQPARQVIQAQRIAGRQNDQSARARHRRRQQTDAIDPAVWIAAMQAERAADQLFGLAGQQARRHPAIAG